MNGPTPGLPWPFPTPQNPLTPQKATKPQRDECDDMPEAPWVS